MKTIQKCYVIGVFPPPYGGVTVKTTLFCELLERNSIIVERINVYGIQDKKKTLNVISRCIKAFASGGSVVYCLDSKRLAFFIRIQTIFWDSFNRTTVIAMGGTFAEIVSKQEWLNKRLKNVKGIWVETAGMKSQLQCIGFPNNVLVFPNPKPLSGCCTPQLRNTGHLRLVFFSKICKDKGADEVMKMVVKLNKERSVSYILDFYGHIDTDIKEDFEDFVNNFPHVRYMGVFDSTKASVYKKLNEYDVLLFPTKWKAEGVPGILVEAKMAGVAVIATDIAFNTEIINERDNEGMIIRGDIVEGFVNALLMLANNGELLNSLKLGSYKSQNRYSIENYNDMIKDLI